MSATSGSDADMSGTTGSLHRNRHPTGHSMTSLQKIITGSMETFFYRWGFLVATHPLKAIFGCLLLTAICGLGLLNFKQENRPDILWLPRDSEFARNTEWLRKNFPSPIRTSWTIVSAENVLVPQVMRVIIDIHDKVKRMQITSGQRWEDICFKLPITKFLSKRKKRSLIIHEKNNNTGFFSNNLDDFEAAFNDEFFSEDAALKPQNGDGGFAQLFSIPDELYCSIIKDLDEACFEVNPFELWEFNRTLFESSLSQEEIIRVINHKLISPVFGRKVNYTVELGGKITRNDKGEVIGAQSIMLRWAVGINQTVLANGKAVSDSTGEIVDSECLEWEKKWTELMKNISASLPPGINAYFVNAQSWMDISEATLFDDGLLLAVGFLVMFVYVGLMLGRFNLVEQRPFLTLAGLSCVALACIVSYGICSLFNIVYGPINKIMPFLLLGIGIDDCFIIMQCWNNLFPSSLTTKSKLSIPEKMSLTMKHAGVSITVTSLTDAVAFLVGSTTILPGLQSFCLYATVAIITIFIFQATYFVAFFALDQKRVEQRRNGFVPWIKYKESDYIQNSSSQTSFGETLFDKVISKYIFTKWGKSLVILITATFLGITIYGNTLLRQAFDPLWFLPDDSYMSQYIKNRELYYPGTGYPAFVVANEVNWSKSFEAFDGILKDLKSTEALYQFDNWYEDFKEYSNTNFGTDIPSQQLTQSKVDKYIGKFLYSPSGSKHRAYFKVNGKFSCGESVPPVKTIVMPLRFKKFKGPEEHLPAMKKIKSLLANGNMTFINSSPDERKFFVWGTGLVAWETDLIISAELYRNVALSLICVLVTTFLLLANFRVCFLCGLCVVFTLCNVGGFMHFWGLTIDTVSCIDIVLAIGLCVDYASHIALAFLQVKGTRESRAKLALKNIGPAVLNGGFSTFLAVMLLATSKSHAFQSFFKIFTVVIIFGLFHGLIFLPVILSIFGPEPYPFADSRDDLFVACEEQKSPKCVELQSVCAESQKLFYKDADTISKMLDTKDPLLSESEMLDKPEDKERTQQ